ncbi:MAG: endonuclease/exonuclease/phosphatase family protein [Candidatus Cyclobacteriaceae bacterium M2_1C_046]
MNLNNGIRNSLFFLAVLATILIAIFSILGFFGYHSWLVDLFSHFRLQYLLMAILCLLVFILYKKFRWAAAAFVVCLINFVEIYPYLSFSSHNQHSCELKVSAINVLSINRESGKVIDFIKKEDPDIIILQEYTEWWETALKEFTNTYAFKYEINRSDNFGIALISKTEPSSIEMINFSKASVPSLLATFRIEGKDITVLATHPVPPATKRMYEDRNEQLLEISEIKGRLGEYFIVAGDLNITPYSWYFKNLKNSLNAEDARAGFGLNATWPTLPSPLQIPIDHILVSQNLEVTDFNNGTYTGSDHYPVTVCLKIN